MAAALLEEALRYVLHVPESFPYVTGFWCFLQALWLRAAEPKSKALFFYVAFLIAALLSDIVPAALHSMEYIGSIFDTAQAVLYLCAIFVFRSEMQRHFNITEPRGLVLSGVMTFLFNNFYFQYWLHDLYEQQNDSTSVLAVPVE